MCTKESVASSFFRRGGLALAVSAAFASATGVAGEKLDMSFIQGGAGVNPEVWTALNGSYAPGRYLVDLSLNGKEAGKQILDVTPQDSNELCLTEAWLTKAGIYVSADYFREGYDATRQCWVLTKAPSVKVDFDVSTQSLALSIPQKGLVKIPENVDWDYGTSAFRVNYNANANTGRNNTPAFGSADLKASIGRRVVSSSATVSGGVSSYLNASYSGDRAYLNGALNHSQSGGASGSVSVSGSVLAVPAAKDIMFSRTTGDTVAVVNVKDTPGVKVTSGDGRTDSDGNLVVPLNSYDWNTVTIDAGTLPLNTELSTTSMKVVPTDRAVVWMPFDALRIKRYLLQVKQRDGEFVPGGTWARDSKNTPLGFVANNGVLMINTVDAPGDITLGQCRIPAAKLQDTEKLQEITCE